MKLELDWLEAKVKTPLWAAVAVFFFIPVYVAGLILAWPIAPVVLYFQERKKLHAR